jgi:uncharacterized UBP type Zn finger protein
MTLHTDPGTVLGVPKASPNGTAPRCEHLHAIRPVEPRAAECAECQTRGRTWVRLVVCLTCGWVACSDDSPRRHARAHYEETDHPIVGALGSGRASRWCYVHQRAV